MSGMDQPPQLKEGSLREAAAQCGAARKKRVHVGAAIMPDYLDTHYDPYSSVLNEGMHRSVKGFYVV